MGDAPWWVTARMWIDYVTCRLIGHAWGWTSPFDGSPLPDQCRRCGDVRAPREDETR